VFKGLKQIFSRSTGHNPNTPSYWDKLYQTEISGNVLRTDDKLSEIIDLFNTARSILDFGTGTGANVYKLSRMLSGKHFTLVDHSESAIEFARRMLPVDDKNAFEFATRLKDVENRKFDLIMLIEVLEHIRDYESLIESLWQMLEPDGILLISVPVKGWRDRNREHINKFTIASMFHLLRSYSKWVHISPRTYSKRSKRLSTAYFYIRK